MTFASEDVASIDAYYLRFSVQIQKIAAFSDGDAGGNPAGVVVITQLNIAIDSREWAAFEKMTQQIFVAAMLQLAQNVQLGKYKKHRRGPKVQAPARTSSKNELHVSTARLLLAARNSP